MLLVQSTLYEHSAVFFRSTWKVSCQGQNYNGTYSSPNRQDSSEITGGNQIRRTQVSETGAAGNMYVDAHSVNGGPLPGFQRYSIT